MRKTHFFTTVLSIFLGLLISCGSGSSGEDVSEGGNYFRFKANGVTKNYNNAFASYNFIRSRNKHSSLTITGYELKGVSSNNPTLSIQLDAALVDSDGNWEGRDLVPDTYTAAYNRTYGLICNHYVTGFDNYIVDNENFVLHLKHIDKHRASGTFAGVLKDHSGNAMAITEGEFNVRVIYKEVEN